MLQHITEGAIVSIVQLQVRNCAPSTSCAERSNCEHACAYLVLISFGRSKVSEDKDEDK